MYVPLYSPLQNGLPKNTPIERVSEGVESSAFKAEFFKWDPPVPAKTSSSASVEQTVSAEYSSLFVCDPNFFLSFFFLRLMSKASWPEKFWRFVQCFILFDSLVFYLIVSVK